MAKGLVRCTRGSVCCGYTFDGATMRLLVVAPVLRRWVRGLDARQAWRHLSRCGWEMEWLGWGDG